MSVYEFSEILAKIKDAVVGVFDIAELQNRVVEVSKDIFDAEACSLFLVDEDRKCLQMTAARGYSERFIGKTAPLLPREQVVEYPKNNAEKLGLTGWIASTAKPFMANSVAELQAHPHWLGIYDPEQLGPGKKVHNFYGVPLEVSRDEVIGVLKVEGKREGGAFQPFTDDDTYLFDILASHIAIAIADARRVEEIQRQGEQLQTITNALHKVVGALSEELPMQYLLDDIVATTADVLSAEACVLFLLDEERGLLVERAGKGYVAQLIGKAKYPLIPREELIEQPIRREDRVGLTAWIAITGEPFLARNNTELRAHPHWRGQYDKEHYPPGSGKRCESFLGVPLEVGEKVVGVLKVENKQVDGQYIPFAQQDSQVFETLARSIAIAIGTIREQRIKQEQQVTDAMYRVSQALVGRFELEPLLEEIVRTGMEIFDAEACVVFLVDEQDKTRLIETKGEGYVKKLEGVAEYRLIPRKDLIERPEDRVGLTAWIAITGEPFLAHSNAELKAHPHWRGRYDKEHYSHGKRCESFLGLPLRVGDDVLGVLKVENKKSGDMYVPFDERDQRIFQFLVNGAAIAIQNARDFQELQEAQELAAIGRSAAAMAHRIGGHLQTIQSAVDFLSEDLRESGKASEQNLSDIEDIIEQVEQMVDAIERVRKAAASLKPSLDRCDIREILRASFTENRSFVKQFEGRGIQIELIGLDQLTDRMIWGDSALLFEAFSYLIDNALDAVSDEGYIAIRVSESNGSLNIEVQDDGPGIDKAKLTRESIFEPFTTTKKGGWGLGLFLTRRNIEAHGGAITYESKVGGGACFRIELPRYRRKEG